MNKPHVFLRGVDQADWQTNSIFMLANELNMNSSLKVLFYNVIPSLF